MRLPALLLLALVLAGCAAGGPRGVPAAAVPLPPPETAPVAVVRWKAVLVAAEDTIPAFDNATRRFASFLAGHGGAPADVAVIGGRSKAGRAILDRALDRIARLQPAPGEGCLVFMTGHGAPERGLVFPAAKTALAPARLDAALDAGCGAAPTVVVMSSCFSGVYTEGALSRGNRIVATAARPDRPSFGCSVEQRYTYFDGCFLDALEAGTADWVDVFRTTAGCVAAQEKAKRFTPSEPQLWLGPAVAALAVTPP